MKIKRTYNSIVSVCSSRVLGLYYWHLSLDTLIGVYLSLDTPIGVYLPLDTPIGVYLSLDTPTGVYLSLDTPISVYLSLDTPVGVYVSLVTPIGVYIILPSSFLFNADYGSYNMFICQTCVKTLTVSKSHMAGLIV